MASSNQGHGSPKEVLVGHYIPIKRQDEVMTRFDKELKLIQKCDFSTDKSLRETSQSETTAPAAGKEEKDLDYFYTKIQGIIVDVAKFKSEHLNSEYRTLQWTCDKLLNEVDNFHHMGDPILKEKREGLVALIHRISDRLLRKVHNGDKNCENCETFRKQWNLR